MNQTIHFQRKIILLLCCIQFTAFSQTDINPTTNINIKTPEVAALLKFLETPVSFNTGLTNISVPIYTIEEGDIIYPITVDYNSLGINVNERAGWVGMNFSINQPQITRMVRGLPDDSPKGFIKENIWKVNTNYIEQNWGGALLGGQSGLIDLESDDYRVIMPNGENIRFYFSQDRSTKYPYGELIQIPITNNKVVPIFNSNLITGWVVTGSDGTIYTYGAGNATSSTTTYDVNGDNLPILDNKVSGFQTSWMLNNIKSITNELNFFYHAHVYTDCNIGDERRNIAHDNLYPENSTDNDMNVVHKIYQKNVGTNFLLKEIIGDFGSVKFNLSENIREDYSYGKMLSDISIFDKNIIRVNTYSFDYIYKTSLPPSAPFISCGTLQNLEDLTKRMFLDKITIIGNGNDLKDGKPKYRFVYNSLLLPHRFSYARDWWGYYNGATDNASFIPTRFRYDPLMPERNVNSAFSQAGMLTEMISPLGGISKFEYESNRALNTRPISKKQKFVGGMAENRGEVDGINIIPSVKEVINFDTQSATLISDLPAGQRGRKLTYEFPFTLDDNVVGYYNNMLFGNNYNTLNQDIKIEAFCDTCIYPPNEGGDQSLPLQNGCAVYFSFKKGNVIEGPFLISGALDGVKPMQVGVLGNTGNNLTPQEYTVIVEIYTGKTTPIEPGPLFLPQNSVQINLSWDVYNPSLVTKIGNHYDMAIGGHRIKKIKTFESLTASPIIKEYSYKDQDNVESGILNIKLNNFFAFRNYFYIVSENYYPLQYYNGQPTGYSFVTEKTLTESGQKLATYHYPFFDNLDPEGYGACHLAFDSFGQGHYPCIDNPSNGKLMEHKIGSELTTTTFYSTPNPSLNVKYVIGYNVNNRVAGDIPLIGDPDFTFAKYKISSFHDEKPTEIITTENFNGSEIQTISINNYDTASHTFLKSTTKSISGQETIETRLSYPPDLIGKPYMNELTLANRISTPIKMETYRSSNKINEKLTTYKKNVTTYNQILPNEIYSANFPNVLPNTLNVGNLEKTVTFDLYDSKGNILQYTTEGGTKVSIIWGYYNTKPIAKIENFAYNLVNAQTIAQLQNMSNADTTPTTEASLRNQLKTLITTYPDALITTYTHDPLIGVTSITDPKGYTTYYEYDEFGRLANLRDTHGNMLSKNDYHYKN